MPTTKRIVELNILYIIIIIFYYLKKSFYWTALPLKTKRKVGIELASCNWPHVSPCGLKIFQGQTGFTISEYEMKQIFSLMVESILATDRIEMEIFI